MEILKIKLLKNILEYLKSIPDVKTANLLLSAMEKQFFVKKWKISDFIRSVMKSEHIANLVYFDEMTNLIISEVKIVTKLLKLS